ncbi:MAG: flagellar basal body P-ring protein FlgI [Planctomycetes bacterium]|nr:flagellar basal body P-ring protein FlgI [Planctomycetota bacterium]
MIISALLLALALVQTPAPASGATPGTNSAPDTGSTAAQGTREAPAEDGGKGPGAQDAGVLLTPKGGIQAPTQPNTRSTATFTQGPRNEPSLGRGVPSTRIRAPLGSLVSVRGQEENHVSGIGLVTGLGGTGDSVNFIRAPLTNFLLTHNIKIDPQQIVSKNAALVSVEAVIPPGTQPGQKIDVRVSAIGDAKSLESGVLLFTELSDSTGSEVYATASGPITVSGFSRGGEAGGVSRNSTTVGVLTQGGKVERGIQSNVVSELGYVYLDSHAVHSSYGNVVRIAEAINGLYPGVAQPLNDSRGVRVRVPEDVPESQYMAFLDTILRREIEPDDFARVLVNERTGVVIMGEGVRLRPLAVTFGNLTVTVAESKETSQPGPLSGGQTQSQPRTDLTVNEDNNGLVLIPGAATLEEVVEVLNVLGTTPRDLISVLEAMSQGGMLLAEVQRM